MTKITTQEQLNQMIDNADEGILECFILLNGGLRSSKDISYNDENSYYIYNEMDDSDEVIDFNKLKDSFIGEAITKGALFAYN